MDDEHHGHAPEHYFPAIDETEAPDPHDVAMAAVSGEIHQDLFPHPSFTLVDGDTHTQGETFFYPANVAGNPTTAGYPNPTYGFHQIPAAGLTGYTADYSWQHAGHNVMFPGVATAAGNMDAPSSTYGYMPYGQEQQHEVQTEPYPSSFDESYVAPANIEQPVSFAYDWNTHDAQTSEHDLASAYSQTGHGSTSLSPIETGTGARTPSSHTSTSSSSRFSSMYAGTANFDSQTTTSMGGGISVAPSDRTPKSTSATKKGKAKAKPTPGNRSSAKAGPSVPPLTAVASSSGESSRSGTAPSSGRGSRSSGRAAPPPAERGDDKKARGSHNLVEKQYRNRLNARFKELADALPPDALRARGTGVAREVTAGTEAADRGPSKAEVLESTWQHIRQLEAHRDNLANEVGELQGAKQRLQQLYAGQVPPQGQQVDEPSDIEEDENEEE